MKARVIPISAAVAAADPDSPITRLEKLGAAPGEVLFGDLSLGNVLQRLAVIRPSAVKVLDGMARQYYLDALKKAAKGR